MILLDTNVVLELAKPMLSPHVTAWFARTATADLYLSAITEAELRLGLQLMPHGHRRNQIAGVVNAIVEVDFEGRILPFDSVAARHYAEIVAARRRLGRPISMPDAQIAAIAKANAMPLATRNVRDFELVGVEVIDPWADIG